MSLEDLRNLYEKNLIQEGWKGLSTHAIKKTHGLQDPQLAKPGLSYRNNKLGTSEPTMAGSSVAGNVQFGNPYEQEEGEALISKQEVMNKINNILEFLDEDSPADRVALMEISKLREEIKKL